MVHLYTHETTASTVFMALLTFFITPYVLVEVFHYRPLLSYGIKDSCQVSFIIGFILSLLFWNKYVKHLIKY